MDDTEYPEVSLLETLRMRKGASLQTVVKATRVSHKTIRRYELAQTPKPHPSSLNRLAEFYGVSPGLILNDMRRRARLAGDERAAA
jgi:transcriptional regulator with XRE-family HTH domain